MKRLFIIYIISSIFVFLILGIAFYEKFLNHLDVYLINLSYLITFSGVILLFLKSSKLRIRHLLFFSFIIPFFLGAIYVFSIYEHSGYLFQYVPSDAPFYDEMGRRVSGGNVFQEIGRIMQETKYGIDDMGMIFYVGVIYKIIDAPILVKLVNLVVNLINTMIMFRICLIIMNKRYAIFSALCYSISSFNIWFLITGLKEPVMLLGILVYIYSTIKLHRTRNALYWIPIIIGAMSPLLFRIEVSIFLIIAGLFGYFFRNGFSKSKIIFTSIIMVAFLSTVFLFRDTLKLASLTRENATVYSGNQETSSNISLPIVAASGLIGPFPTLIPSSRKRLMDVSVYGASLIFKMSISLFAILGIAFVIIEKQYIMIPAVAFLLVETLALIIIDSTFKLRYSIPHYPFFYILGFYGMYQLFEKQDRYKTLLTEISVGYQIGTIALVLLWNIVRL